MCLTGSSQIVEKPSSLSRSLWDANACKIRWCFWQYHRCIQKGSHKILFGEDGKEKRRDIETSE